MRTAVPIIPTRGQNTELFVSLTKPDDDAELH